MSASLLIFKMIGAVMCKLLEIKGITKYYGEHKILDQLTFDINQGEILGIIGANGSGKTTLLNILDGNSRILESGGYQGDILMKGEKIILNSHEVSQRYGIGMVHQELSLFENFDVGTNITLTREITNPFRIIDIDKTYQEASEELKKLGCDVSTKKAAKQLPIAVKQFVEIARELNKKNLRLILLDEPTSSLNQEAAKKLLDTIMTIKREGTSVVFVSHRLEEVMAVCDRIIIMKDGKKVSEYSKGSYHIETLAMDMIGKSITKASRHLKAAERMNQTNTPIISFRIDSAFDGHRIYEDIKLDIKKGEIIGITGLAGHGQTIFAETVVGGVPFQGDIIYENKAIPAHNIKHIIQSGIMVIQEDRKGKSLLLNRSVEKNIVFTALHTTDNYLRFPRLKKLSLTHEKKVTEDAQRSIAQYHIVCQSQKQKVGELSGGNQQKVCFARALLVDPKVLFVGEPTRGIDVYSKEIILNMMLDINREKGTTIIVSSSEIEELKRICDRIVVMYEGTIFKIISPDAEEEEFSLAISGQSKI